MRIETLSMFGGLGALAALMVMAIVALRVDDEPPPFVYLVGLVLTVAAMVLFTGAGIR
jgi:hypothetical protein